MGLKIAVIGAGGKTTAMKLIAKQNERYAVLLTTTTRIFPMTPPQCRVCLIDPTGEEVENALSVPGIVCAGTQAGEGKLGPLSPAFFSGADLTIYEGDGSKGLPLKLHREGEPVILPGTDWCLIVAGLSAWGKPVGETVHCYELYDEWKKDPQRRVGSLEILGCVLETAEASGLPKEKVKVYLNQADALSDRSQAEALAAALTAQGLDARWGSLEGESRDLLAWLQEGNSLGGGL